MGTGRWNCIRVAMGSTGVPGEGVLKGNELDRGVE